MKKRKIIPTIAIASGIAAFVAYRMKKNNEKQIIDLDQMLAEDEDAFYKDENHHSSTKEVEDEKNIDIDTQKYVYLTNDIITRIKTKTEIEIAILEEEGDVHEHERPIEHRLSFASQEDVEAFKEAITSEGFAIEKSDDLDHILVMHLAAIKEETLLPIILHVADCVYQHHGQYLGWRSKVSYE